MALDTAPCCVCSSPAAFFPPSPWLLRGVALSCSEFVARDPQRVAPAEIRADGSLGLESWVDLEETDEQALLSASDDEGIDANQAPALRAFKP